MESGAAREGWGGLRRGKYVDAHAHMDTYASSYLPLLLPPCARTRAKQAQGLNFNYFLFGRYNISMLAGACPARARLSLPSLSSNVIIIILVCARSVISCTTPSTPIAPLCPCLSLLSPFPPSPRNARLLCRYPLFSFLPCLSRPSALFDALCVPRIVQLKSRNCPLEFILELVAGQAFIWTAHGAMLRDTKTIGGIDVPENYRRLIARQLPTTKGFVLPLR